MSMLGEIPGGTFSQIQTDIVISPLCFLRVVLHYMKLRHSRVTHTSIRLRRMRMGNNRTRAVMFSVACFF